MDKKRKKPSTTSKFDYKQYSYEISFFKENRDTIFLKLYTFLNTFIKLITLNQQLVEKKGAIQTG